MKLSAWKQRVRAIRESNKRTRVYAMSCGPFRLPTECIVEGQIPGKLHFGYWSKKYYNYYGELLYTKEE